MVGWFFFLYLSYCSVGFVLPVLYSERLIVNDFLDVQLTFDLQFSRHTLGIDTEVFQTCLER